MVSYDEDMKQYEKEGLLEIAEFPKLYTVEQIKKAYKTMLMRHFGNADKDGYADLLVAHAIRILEETDEN